MKGLLLLFLTVFLQCDCLIGQIQFNSNGKSRNKIIPKKKWKTDMGTKTYLVSVKLFPSDYHLCDAFFISADVLLTTARCIYKKNPKTMFIDLSSSMEETGKIFQIKETVTHPEFDIKPHKNDVGLIKLKQKVKNVAIYTIPANETAQHNKSYVFTWKFTPDQKKYILTYLEVNLVSRSICSDALREYIDCDYICPTAKSRIRMGPYDQGSPLGEVVGKNLFFAWGIYNRQGPEYNLRMEKFTNLLPYAKWVSKFL